jgi:hypothetical protein
MRTSIAGFQDRVNHRAAAATTARPGAVRAARAWPPRASGRELARPAQWRGDAGPDLADGVAGALLYGVLVLLVAALA